MAAWRSATRQRVGVAALFGGGAAVWFVLSWFVMGTAPADAAVESLGATLGLLIMTAVVGTARRQARLRAELSDSARQAGADDPTRLPNQPIPGDTTPRPPTDVRLDKE